MSRNIVFSRHSGHIRKSTKIPGAAEVLVCGAKGHHHLPVTKARTQWALDACHLQSPVSEPSPHRAVIHHKRPPSVLLSCHLSGDTWSLVCAIPCLSLPAPLPAGRAPAPSPAAGHFSFCPRPDSTRPHLLLRKLSPGHSAPCTDQYL